MRLGFPGCHLRHGLIDPALLKLIGEEEAVRLKAIPLFKVRDTLTVAMAEPQSLPKVDRLRQLTKCKIRPVLALAPNIREFVGKYKGGDVNVDAFLDAHAVRNIRPPQDDFERRHGLHPSRFGFRGGPADGGSQLTPVCPPKRP